MRSKTDNTDKQIAPVTDSNNENENPLKIDRIVSCRGRGSKRIYRVKFLNSSNPLLWVKQQDVPKKIMEEYFILLDNKEAVKKRFLQKAQVIKNNSYNPNIHNYNTRSKN